MINALHILNPVTGQSVPSELHDFAAPVGVMPDTPTQWNLDEYGINVAGYNATASGADAGNAGLAWWSASVVSASAGPPTMRVGFRSV
jgi:hypothetical protein